jgi:hypothetical protein
MVIIANPIYDVVFRYLMANLDVAKGVISCHKKGPGKECVSLVSQHNKLR